MVPHRGGVFHAYPVFVHCLVFYHRPGAVCRHIERAPLIDLEKKDLNFR